MTLKVALLLYGQPRFVDNEQVQNDYKKNIIEKYDTTVFCHAWFAPNANYSYSSWSNLSHHNVPDNAIQIIREVYNPRLLIYDAPMEWAFTNEVQTFVDDKFGTEGHWNKANYSNLISQLWSMQRIADYVYLHQVYFKTQFDWIVLARYDTILQNFPDLTTLNTDKLYLPDNHRGFPDMIQFFGSKYLAYARNVFFDINDVYKGIAEPTPESFKHQSFLKRFEPTCLEYHPVRAFAVR